MAHTADWDSTYESHPPDTDNVGGGADDIRDLALNIRERVNVDHYMEIAGTQADHGEHKKLTFHEPISTPSNIANKGFLYMKDVSAKGELHWEDEDGNELQLTDAGAMNVSGVIPAGTKMLFYQDTAPTGWTIQNTLDDKLVFISKGSAAGGQTGGAAHSAGSWTISGLSSTAVSGTTSASSSALSYVGGGYTLAPAGHTHTFSGTPTISQSGAWRPAAYVCIICEKD